MKPNSNSSQDHATITTWQWLGYLGLIPFITSLLISLLINHWHARATEFFIFYSAIILSFMAGTLWQVRLKPDNSQQHIASNIFCLIAFLALLTTQLASLIILALGYLGLFQYEEFIAQRDRSERKYLNMRFMLTSIVVVLHLLALFFWSG